MLGVRVVYRVVRSNPPTRRDFFSPAALGRRFQDAKQRALAEGVSVFATEEQARRLARRFHLGSYIAEVNLPEECRILRTQRTPGHHTVWAAADLLLEAVVRVVSVE